VTSKGGETFAVPVRADAVRGGLVADGAGLDPALFPADATGVLRGRWGFSPFVGPSFRLESASAGRWRLADDDAQALVVGRTDTLKLTGGAANCVEGVKLLTADGALHTLTYKVEGPGGGLTVAAPLAEAPAGAATLVVASAGGDEARLPVRAYAEGGRLDKLIYHVADAQAVLEGARLDEVAGLTLAGAAFDPGALTSTGPADRLELTAAAAPALKPGAKVTARVRLADGRTERLEATVEAPRPRILVTARTLRGGPASGGAPLTLADKDEVADGDTLVFTIAPAGHTALRPHTAVEVATADGAYSTRLPGSDVVLADTHTAVATLDTAKALDPSAYGPLRVRIVDDRGESDWQPLATLVRLPKIDTVDCGGARSTCTLKGRALFLISALSADPKFGDPVSVPAGFPGEALDVPRPRDGLLYVKLHDDPQVVSVVRLAAR
jgi:hypothetical protein